MSYAQKDYNQIQGNNGINTIAEVGSLLTAFANLLERFGEGVDPATLNATFIDDSIYLYKTDDIRDRLAISSISAYDSTIGICETGNGVPTTHNAIIRLDYDSALTGTRVSTYGLVVDNVAGTFIDSFDGVTKQWSVYGEPVEWWGFKQYDAITIAPLRTPVIEQPKQPETYEVVRELNGLGKLDDESGTITVKPGIYYVADRDDFHVYITAKPGDEFGAWIHTDDNIVESSALSAGAVSQGADDTPDEVKIPVRVTHHDPLEWQSTYVPNLGIVECTAKNDAMIHDYSGELADVPLKADGSIIPVAGWFTIEGIEFARTKKSVDLSRWYGIPRSNLRRADGEDDTPEVDSVKEIEDIDQALDHYLESDDKDFKFEIGDERPSARERVIKLGATVDGKIAKVSKVINFGKK